MLKEAWSLGSVDSMDEEEGDISIPSNFKRLTIQDRHVVLQRPNWKKPETLGVLYDGAEDAKKIDLVEPGEEPRLTWIAN